MIFKSVFSCASMKFEDSAKYVANFRLSTLSEENIFIERRKVSLVANKYLFKSIDYEVS